MNELTLIGKRMTIFTYSLDHLMPKERTKFYYALNGRTTVGVLKQTDSIHLGRSVLITSESNTQELIEFFKLWGCKHKTLKVLIDE